MGVCRVLVLSTCLACQASPSDTDSESDSSHPPQRVTEDLIDHNLWEKHGPASDPFADHRPGEIECGLAGAFVEDDTLEINTGTCNYYAASQPLLVGLHTGDPVSIELRHFDLIAPEPATAHVAVLIGGDLVWEAFIEVPGPAAVLHPIWEASKDYPTGTPVDIHLHNHGQNTWTLAWIRGDVLVE